MKVLAALLSLSCLSAPGWALGPGNAQALQKNEVPPGAEGPLSNDSFLPTAETAQRMLAEADVALGKARGSSGAESDRYYIECFDAWQSSLAIGRADASTWVPVSRGPERTLSEGLRYGIQRRVESLAKHERKRWSGRIETLAGPSLRAAESEPRELKRLVQLFPLTTSAARASLLLADTALERGAFSEARTWLSRARDDLPDPETQASLARAIEQRSARLPVAQPEASWDHATGFEVVSAIPFGLAAGQRNPGIQARQSGLRGARPGLVFLSKSRLAIQAPGQIQLLRIAPNGVLSVERGFDHAQLKFANGAELPFDAAPFDERRARRAPGWQCAPAAAGNALFVVSGHSLPDGLPNALLSIELPPPLLPGSLMLPGQGAEPRLNWAIVGNEWVDSEGNLSPIELLAELEDLEFQPGPVVSENRVLVQARSYSDVVHSWLLCLDRHTGRLQWSHLLGSGPDLLEDQGRLGAASPARLCAPALTLIPPAAGYGERLFVSTNLGFGVLVDLVDGRPFWSVKNRRRDVQDLGWDGYEALLSGSGADQTLWWAAFDSDRLYALKPFPIAGDALERLSIQAARPLPIGESRTLLGADATQVLVQGRAGRESTISSLAVDAALGSKRVDALYLGPGDEFMGRGLISPRRVLACSERGLYLFDRTRELYLLDYCALPRLGGARDLAPGGDLYTQGGLLLALGKNGIWSFRAR